MSDEKKSDAAMALEVQQVLGVLKQFSERTQSGEARDDLQVDGKPVQSFVVMVNSDNDCVSYCCAVKSSDVPNYGGAFSTLMHDITGDIVVPIPMAAADAVVRFVKQWVREHNKDEANEVVSQILAAEKSDA